ncbi:NAD(P)(+) transhydrogenase (Re/Si-specific) subunit beta [Kribbella koreensis]|uniref:NAD(P)(+) transhydrogenase (Re/Si-specific) subunit beta n=1 Tax=Kribbella koreensis TaxID=57909 RepID=UPI0031D83A7A
MRADRARPTQYLTAIVLGVTFVLPIGGADMPVVVSLLNACTGMAVAMAGFLLSNTVLITAGALVGASGTILTVLMAKAMNRSLGNIVAGGFGSGDHAVPAGITDDQGGAVQSVAADDVAMQLAYAGSVVIVPGYGLAAARAQNELVDLAGTLAERPRCRQGRLRDRHQAVDGARVRRYRQPAVHRSEDPDAVQRRQDRPRRHRPGHQGAGRLIPPRNRG